MAELGLEKAKTNQKDIGALFAGVKRKKTPEKEGVRGIRGAALGVVKGLGATVAGASALGEKIIGLGRTKDTLGERLQEGALKPRGIAEKIGFGAEQIGELFLPTGVAGAAAKGARAAKTAIKGTRAFALPVEQITKVTTKAKPQRIKKISRRQFVTEPAQRATTRTRRELGARVVVLPQELSAIERLGARAVGEAAELAGKTAIQTGGDIRETVAAGVTGAAVPVLGAIVKTPLTKIAERLFTSALKPIGKGAQTAAQKAALAKTGLKERVFLTKGGVERVANKIDDLEAELGKAIDAGAAAGKKINTKGLEDFVGETKKLFANTADVAAGEKAVKTLDKMVKDFRRKFGTEIPIEQAQTIKVATGRLLRKSYGELTTVQKEGQKQITRFLKEGIVKEAPAVKDVNARLSKLFELDKQLDRATSRTSRLNLLGVGVKVGALAGGPKGAVIGLLTDLLDRGAIKSGAAIGVNELGNLISASATAGRVPLVVLVRAIVDALQGEEEATTTPSRTPILPPKQKTFPRRRTRFVNGEQQKEA